MNTATPNKTNPAQKTTAAHLLNADTNSSLQTLIRISQKLIDFADQEARALAINDYLGFAFTQQDKEKLRGNMRRLRKNSEVALKNSAHATAISSTVWIASRTSLEKKHKAIMIQLPASVIALWQTQNPHSLARKNSASV